MSPTHISGVEDLMARIPAASKREAMDWSLVLVSQDIETSIDHVPEDGTWALLVPAYDQDRAEHAIRLYQAENQHWPWRQTIFHSDLLFDWASLGWVLLLAVFYAVNENGGGLKSAGVMDSTAVAHGSWWRLFTAVWLHADLGHLATNATIGALLIGLAMGCYGTGVGLLSAYISGAAGNVFASLLSNGPHHSLGSSGMVMGGLGLLAAQSFTFARNPYGPRFLLTGVLGGSMLFVLLGLSVGSDILAHLGGFLGGLVIGTTLALAKTSPQNLKTNSVSAALFAFLIIVPWFLALSK